MTSSSGQDCPWPLERTFSIIKPDATERNLTGAINAVIEGAGLRIVAQKRMRMSRREAETFYAVHKERPFFGELVDFMISGPVVVQVLEGENAVLQVPGDHGRDEPGRRRRRHDPQAVRQVDRRELGPRLRQPDNAKTEIMQFFSGNEIVG